MNKARSNLYGNDAGDTQVTDTRRDMSICETLDYSGGTIRICKVMQKARVCSQKPLKDKPFYKIMQRFLGVFVSGGL